METAVTGTKRLLVSPHARRLARERDIDLARLQGSGPGGRIIARDVDAAVALGTAQVGGPHAAPAGRIAPRPLTPDPAVEGSMERPSAPYAAGRELWGGRARADHRAIPQLTLSVDCRVDDLLMLRRHANATAPQSSRVSFTALLIKAWAMALRRAPAVNAHWTVGASKLNASCDVAVAVGTSHGECMPVVRHADIETLERITSVLREAVRRAQADATPDDTDGTATTVLYNIGGWPIDRLAVPIVTPYATALAVGAAARRPVVVDQRIEPATVMTCTLTSDPRVAAPADAAAALAAFKAIVETPRRLLA